MKLFHIALGCAYLTTFITAATANDLINQFNLTNRTAVCRMYDICESNLIERYNCQRAASSSDIASTIEAMGHISSLRSSDLLLSNILLVPDFLPLEATGAVPVLTVMGRFAVAPENRYSSGKALQKIGVPVTTCLNWQRVHPDNFMYWRTGILCHGIIYKELMPYTNICASAVTSSFYNRPDYTDCEVLPELDNTAICEIYDAIESNAVERIVSHESLSPAEFVDTIHTLGYIRSKHAVSNLVSNIAFTQVAHENLDCNSLQTESCYPVVKALAEIGMPFCESLDLIDSAEPGSLRERLLVRLAELSHGFVFTNYVHSFGSGPTNRYSRIISEYGL